MKENCLNFSTGQHFTKIIYNLLEKVVNNKGEMASWKVVLLELLILTAAYSLPVDKEVGLLSISMLLFCLTLFVLE